MHVHRPLPLRVQVGLFSHRVAELEVFCALVASSVMLGITVVAAMGWLFAGWAWPPLDEWFSFNQPLPVRLVVVAWMIAPFLTVSLEDKDHPLWWLPYSAAALASWMLL